MFTGFHWVLSSWVPSWSLQPGFSLSGKEKMQAVQGGLWTNLAQEPRLQARPGYLCGIYKHQIHHAEGCSHGCRGMEVPSQVFCGGDLAPAAGARQGPSCASLWGVQ